MEKNLLFNGRNLVDIQGVKRDVSPYFFLRFIDSELIYHFGALVSYLFVLRFA